MDWKGLLNTLGPNGKMIVMGISQADIPVSPLALIAFQRSVVGSAAGSLAIAYDMLQFCALHNIRCVFLENLFFGSFRMCSVDDFPPFPSQRSIVGSAAGSLANAYDMLQFCALHNIRWVFLVGNPLLSFNSLRIPCVFVLAR